MVGPQCLGMIAEGLQLYCPCMNVRPSEAGLYHVQTPACGKSNDSVARELAKSKPRTCVLTCLDICI